MGLKWCLGNFCTKKLARAPPGSTQASKDQMSPHTRPTTPCPSGCTLLLRIQDDWCRMIKAGLPRPRAWLSQTRMMSLDSLAQSFCLEGKTRATFSGSVLATSGFSALRDTGGPQPTSINLKRVIAVVRVPLLPSVGPVAPGRWPGHPPSSGVHWLRTGDCSYFEAESTLL